MEKLYKINGNVAEITISKELYPLITIKKAIVNYLENVYIKLEEKNKNVILKIQLKNENDELEKIVGEFYNELLRESLRYDIANETKNLRELIIARALYTTCIDVDGENIEEINTTKTEKYEEEFDINEIAVNWFDSNNNNKEEKKC